MLVVYHVGEFMTSTEYNYYGKFKKVWNSGNILSMTVEEFRTKSSALVGENDIIYFMKDRVTPNKGYQSFTSDKHVTEWVRISRFS